MKTSLYKYHFAYVCFAWVALGVPFYLEFFGIRETLESIIFTLSILLASTYGVLVSLNREVHWTLRLLAIATFSIAAGLNFYPKGEWYLEDVVYPFYMPYTFLLCCYWFFWGRRRYHTLPGEATRFEKFATSPARVPISAAYTCLMWAAIGAPIWNTIIFIMFGYTGFFFVSIVSGSATLAAITGFMLALLVARQIPVLIVAGVTLASTIVEQFWHLTGSMELSFLVALVLGGRWFILQRWDCSLRNTPTERALWKRYPAIPAATHTPPASPVNKSSDKSIEVVLAAAERRRIVGMILWGLFAVSILVGVALLLNYNIKWLSLLWASYAEEVEFESPLAPLNLLLFGEMVWRSYWAYFFLPALVVFLLALPFVWRWRDPARILLLRPFHRGRASRSLARLVRKQLGPFGHVYTLADSDIKTPWYVFLPMLFGQMLFFTFRYREVRTPQQLNRLLRVMRNRYLRNLNWVLSREKIFPVATTDLAWETVVSILMKEVDLILIDISDPTTNIIRELELCNEMGVIDRVVCIVKAGQSSAARVPFGQKVFPYEAQASKGMEDLQQQIAVILSRHTNPKAQSQD